jgi:hypothetical protein
MLLLAALAAIFTNEEPVYFEREAGRTGCRRAARSTTLEGS